MTSDEPPRNRHSHQKSLSILSTLENNESQKDRQRVAVPSQVDCTRRTFHIRDRRLSPEHVSNIDICPGNVLGHASFHDINMNNFAYDFFTRLK